MELPTCILFDHVLWRNILTGITIGIFGFIAFLVQTTYLSYRKRKHLVTALKAEISLLHEHASSSLSPESISKLQSLSLDGDTPFITVDDRYPIFESHQSDLSLLRDDVLTAVIKYYEVDRFISKSLTRFQDDDFQTLPKGRQIDALKSFIDLAKKHKSYGKSALDKLE